MYTIPAYSRVQIGPIAYICDNTRVALLYKSLRKLKGVVSSDGDIQGGLVAQRGAGLISQGKSGVPGGVLLTLQPR